MTKPTKPKPTSKPEPKPEPIDSPIFSSLYIRVSRINESLSILRPFDNYLMSGARLPTHPAIYCVKHRKFNIWLVLQDSIANIWYINEIIESPGYESEREEIFKALDTLPIHIKTIFIPSSEIQGTYAMLKSLRTNTPYDDPWFRTIKSGPNAGTKVIRKRLQIDPDTNEIIGLSPQA